MSRRVSYVLPASDAPVPLLSLPSLTEPRLGRTSPLLLPHPGRGQTFLNRNRNNNGNTNTTLIRDSDPDPTSDPVQKHPRHCLGVSAIALDTSTLLSGRATPEGILYTGGRDGLVAGWELGIPMTRRRRPRWADTPRGERVRWERLELADGGLGGDGWEDNEYEVDEVDSDLDLEEDKDGYDGTSSDGGAGGMGMEGDHSLLFEDGEDRPTQTSGFRFPGGVSGTPSSSGTRRQGRKDLEYTSRWQTTPSLLHHSPPPSTQFRQSVQTHTDWVNDILLCNNNNTVISCSSDRTIRAWAPHDTVKSGGPDLVGVQGDYVKVISYAKQTNTLFSGGLDRQVYLWDVAHPRPEDPVSKLKFPDLIGGEGGKGSIYALTANDQGTLVAAGSPERVVRLWDPRAAGSQDGQSIAGLIGHTDNIRAILLSGDGRHLLSASSDCTVKLWSLAAQRCLHTFTHHTDSVWSLYSDHPNLERFLSGDRAGHLAAVDVTGCKTDYSDGECVLLAKVDKEEGRRGTEGICQIIGMDDEFVWTATGSASVKRWKDVGRKRDRLEAAVPASDRRGSLPPSGLGASSTVAPVTPDTAPTPTVLVDGFIPPRPKKAAVVAFAETSNPFEDPSEVGRSTLGVRRTTGSGAPIAGSILSVASSRTGGAEYAMGRNGIAYAHQVCLGLKSGPRGFGGSTLDMTESDETKARESYLGSAMSFRRSSLARNGAPSLNTHQAGGHATPDPADVTRRDFESREILVEADPLRAEPAEIIRGRHGLIRAMMLNDRQHALTIDTGGQVAVWNVIKGKCLGRYDENEISGVYQESGYDLQDIAGRDSKEALDIVRERIEGESSTITWCTVDTRIGSLTVHVEENRCFDAEVYADEVGYRGDPAFKEDHRINLGKWALANLFAGLIKAEAAELAQTGHPDGPADVSMSETAAAPSITRSPAPTFIPIDRASSRRARSQSMVTGGPSTPGALMFGLATPAITPAILPPAGANNASGRSVRETPGGLPIIPQSPANLGSNAATPMSPMRSPKASESSVPKDYFSIKTSTPSKTTANPPATPGGNLLSSSAPAQTPGGSFMGKFKGFGNKGKKNAGTEPVATAPIAPLPEETEEDAPKSPAAPEREAAQIKLLSQIRSHTFQPPPPSEAPPIDLPADVSLLISEESKEAGAWAVIYRSMVARTEQDMEPLEMAAPGWMLEYLFAGRNRVKEPVKLCFILEPWQGGDPAERLQPMPANNARLTANRVLRIRKVLQYIYDKLELGHHDRRASAASIHADARRGSHDSSLITAQSADGTKSPARFGAVEQARAAAERKTTPESAQINKANGEARTADDVLEVLCNGTVVPLTMTLAATKQYIWQAPGASSSGMDVVLQYRWRRSD